MMIPSMLEPPQHVETVDLAGSICTSSSRLVLDDSHVCSSWNGYDQISCYQRAVVIRAHQLPMALYSMLSLSEPEHCFFPHPQLATARYIQSNHSKSMLPKVGSGVFHWCWGTSNGPRRWDDPTAHLSFLHILLDPVRVCLFFRIGAPNVVTERKGPRTVDFNK